MLRKQGGLSRLRRSDMSTARAGSKNTTASAASAPPLVAPNDSTSTPPSRWACAGAASPSALPMRARRHACAIPCAWAMSASCRISLQPINGAGPVARESGEDRRLHGTPRSGFPSASARSRARSCRPSPARPTSLMLAAEIRARRIHRSRYALARGRALSPTAVRDARA